GQHPPPHVRDPRGRRVGLYERGALGAAEPDIPADAAMDRQQRPHVGLLLPADLRGARSRPGVHPPWRAYARRDAEERTRTLMATAAALRDRSPIELGDQSLTLEGSVDRLVGAAQGVVENEIQLAKLEARVTAVRIVRGGVLVLGGAFLLAG